ncbi:MAG: hypothetical protein JWQ48_2938 [Conexibacter sp.]|nr:hypothetical protein [Conexibacter sp.]
MRRPTALLVLAAAAALGVAAPAVAGAATVGPAVVAVRVQIAGGQKPVPVTGARVVLRAAGRTVGTGRTYGRGLALISGRVPARFELRATGGWIGRTRFHGHLLASVEHHRRRQVAVVDPATTLSATVCHDLHTTPGTVCDHRVRVFLRLPPGTDLQRDLGSDLLFDGGRFLVAARRHGGVTRYLGALEHALRADPRATRDFRKRESARLVHSRVPASASHAKTRAVAAADEEETWLDSLLGFAGDNVDPGSLVRTLYGLISGGGPSVSSQLSSLESQMALMVSDLSGLKAEVGDLETTIDRDTGSLLAADVNPIVNAVTDAESSFGAVLDEAVQIGCGDVGAPTSGPPASCADPQSPGDVCTATAVAANAELATACTAFDGLPRPAGSSASSPQGLVGDFVDELSGNTLQDRDVESLADDLGGDLVSGNPLAQGILQLAGHYVSRNPFFTTADSQQLEDVYGYYLDALLQGSTMRLAYWAFSGAPSSKYSSAVALTVADDRAIFAAAPQPLPSGTFIDTAAYTMWSGQIGALETESAYAVQTAQGATLSLPTAAAHAEAGSVAPSLVGGAPFANWSAAQRSALRTLYGDAPGSRGATPGDYLLGTVNDAPQVWPNLLSDGVWNASGYAVGTRFAQETPSAPGLVLSQSSDEGYFSGGRSTHHTRVPSLQANSCVSRGNSGCMEPTWATGAASGTFDLNNGGDPAEVGGKAVQDWGYAKDETYCVKEAVLDLYCTKHRTYPGITNHLTLPVLFDRTPAPAPAQAPAGSTAPVVECYYWPARADAANACPG